MIPRLVILLAIAALTSSVEAETTPAHGLEAVAHGTVSLGGFWGERLRVHQEVTLPHALDCLEEDGHVENFDLAGRRHRPASLVLVAHA